MSLSSATISIQPTASPTVETFLGLLKVLPKGIYSGGGCFSGPGRSIAVHPFTVKNADGLTITTSAIETIEVPPVISNTVYWLVLYSRAWNPELGDIEEGHVAEFRLILDSLIDEDDDLENYIRFTRFVATPAATSTPILNSYIDSGVAQRVDIQNRPASQSIYSGVSNFNGQSGSVVTHNLGTVNYRVSITPSQNPLVGLGDIWVEKNINYFTVYCIGNETIQFDWQVILAKNSSGSPEEGYSSIPVEGEYEGYTKLGFTGETISNSALYSNQISSNPETDKLIYSKKDFTVVPDDSWSLLVGSSNSSTNPQVSLRWKLLNSQTNEDLYIADLEADASSEVVSLTSITGGGTLDYRAFLIPQAYTEKKPLVERNIANVTFNSLESGTTYRLVIVKNASNYIHGTMSGTSSMQAYHDVTGNYVPLISFIASTEDITAMSIIPSDNKFNTYIDSGVTATAEWLII